MALSFGLDIVRMAQDNVYESVNEKRGLII